jgi:hypothetical protein
MLQLSYMYIYNYITDRPRGKDEGFCRLQRGISENNISRDKVWIIMILLPKKESASARVSSALLGLHIHRSYARSLSEI